MAPKLDDITIHGMSRLHIGDGKERLFWAIVVAFMSILAAFFTRTLILNYNSYEVITTVDTTAQEILQFPTVRFCNGPLLKSLRNINFSTGFQTFQEKFNFFCLFNTVPCAQYVSGESNLDKACVNFNPDGLLYQHEPFHRSGLFLHLFVNHSDYEDINKLNAFSVIDNSMGITVSIKDKHLHKKPGNSKIHLSTGTKTLIGIAVTNITRKPHPYPSKCTSSKGDDLFPGDYTVAGCLTTCWGKAIFKKCNFVIRDLAAVMRGNVVANRTCLRDYIKSRRGQLTTQCNCPIPCEETIYTVTSISSIPWPNAENSNIFRKEISNIFPRENVTDDFVRKHVARVEISFDFLQVTNIREKERYSITNLFSDFGGITGVYLGASFISILELFFLLIAQLKNKLLAKHVWKNDS